jgi:DNA-binding Xre family transcriptional regulator
MPVHSEIDPIQSALAKYAEPFARALAVFVRECADGGRDTASQNRTHFRRALGEPIPISELEPSLRKKLNEIINADEAAARAGTLKMMEFTEDSPAEAAARRLRSILAKRGISQKQLAQMLGVTPAVINRVLKKPDRSKVATLRRIADALHVELREIV